MEVRADPTGCTGLTEDTVAMGRHGRIVKDGWNISIWSVVEAVGRLGNSR